MDTLTPELIDTITAFCSTAQTKARWGSVNRHYYEATRRRLFQNVTITSPRQYLAFLRHLDEFEAKGYLERYVRTLDLSSYTVRGSGWSEQQAKKVIVASDLAQWITRCRFLQQIVIGDELMHVFVEPDVMRAIFTTDHPFLQVIDFTGFCDQKVTKAMADLFLQQHSTSTKKDEGKAISPLLLPTLHTPQETTDDDDRMDVHHWKMPPRLTQLSFHLCMALSPTLFFQPFFERLASNGNTITRLDLAHTPITNQVFTHVNPSTLTHLNLQGCRGIHCCDGLAPFLRQCTNLVELNLNMHFNGVAVGNQFCSGCLGDFLRHDLKPMRRLRVLDLGGQAHLTDGLLIQTPIAVLAGLHYLSVAYATHVTLDGAMGTLLGVMKQIEYLNVTRTSMNRNPRTLLDLCARVAPQLQVIEVEDRAMGRDRMAGSTTWAFSQHGRRGYYARQGIDPRFKYSQKLLLLDEQPQSPMMKYWSFSY